MQLRWLNASEIPATQWDSFIHKSEEANIYATFGYLNLVSEGRWKALIIQNENDGAWQAVLPVALKSRLALKYLYQPPFCQQLGLFTRKNLNCDTLWTAIFNALDKAGLWGICCLNQHNTDALEDLMIRPLEFAPNYVLDLKESYAAIKKRYARSVNVGLRISRPLTLKTENNPEGLITLFQENKNLNNRILRPTDVKILRDLLNYLFKQKCIQQWSAYNETGQLIATAVFPFYRDARGHKTFYYLLSATTKEGRTMRAVHGLIDMLVKENAQTDAVLDFEGSRLPGVARFMASFGAQLNNYPVYRFNNLKPKVLGK